ncbi:MAG: bifunctional diaminohydroxyphosphoribosylaminopyrimidine deaminase/5-amino-6-(5-phosphoribosylamino)uracil reductase RibD [Deltaproteobacteria bacterium]
MPTHQDEKYMSIALKLAKRAEGMTSPNPLVGAVVVKKGEIIGKGYHRKAGLPHAEIEAFKDAEKKGHNINGSTLYVSLEPCCHKGKRTPPCVDAIIEKGVTKVVVGSLDPNPKVSGKGVKTLGEKGINTVTGVLEQKSRDINESFKKYITTGKPFVILKLAATLDGKIAARTGDSKWIGSEKQREYAHKLRSKADAVMVGIGTVLTDDPRLNVRLRKKTVRQPVPVVLDPGLRTPPESSILALHDSVFIATGKSCDKRKREKLESAGAKIIEISTDRQGLLNLNELLVALGDYEITSLLVEGGSRTAAHALRSGIVDKVVFFYAPKLMGGDGLSMIGDLGISKVGNSLEIDGISIKRYGSEFMIEGYIKKRQPEG